MLRSVLLPCQSWGPTGQRYSGWIWNELGHFIVFSGEKLRDLVLLKKNSKPSGELDLDTRNFWLWAAFWFGGKLYPSGCVLLSCAALCWGCLRCSIGIRIKKVWISSCVWVLELIPKKEAEWNNCAIIRSENVFVFMLHNHTIPPSDRFLCQKHKTLEQMRMFGPNQVTKI